MFRPTYGLDLRYQQLRAIYKVRNIEKHAEIFKIGRRPNDESIFLLRWEHRNIPFLYDAPVELAQINLKNNDRIKYAQFPVLGVLASHVGADIARFQYRGRGGGDFESHYFEGMEGAFYKFENQTEYDRALSLVSDALPALAYDGHLHGHYDPTVCVEVISQKTPWNDWSEEDRYIYERKDRPGNYLSFARQLSYVSARMRGIYKVAHYELLRDDERSQQIAAALMADAEHVATVPELLALLITERVKEVRPGWSSVGDLMRDKVAEQFSSIGLPKRTTPSSTTWQRR